MSCDSVELVIIGPEEQANEVVEGIPVAHRNIPTANAFRIYFADLRALVSILLLFFNSSIPFLHPILKEIKKRKNQIIQVVICDNSNTSIANNAYMRVVPETLLKYKIKSTIARFIEKECTKQGSLINTDLRLALNERRTKILQQFHTNDELKGCHILLIPLNATPRETHNAQQRLKIICHDLHPNDYQFIIRTLSDFIPDDETNLSKSTYTAFLKEKYGGDIEGTIIQLSLIRMYVVGNESYIPNKYAGKLVEAELDINQPHTLKYVHRCSFIMNGPVHPRFTGDLVPIFGQAWQSQSVVPITLDELRNDIQFHANLPHVYDVLRNREMRVNCELRQQSLANAKDMTRFSNELHLIELARNGPEEKEASGDIGKDILANLWTD